MEKIFYSMVASVAAMPLVSQIPAETDMEKLGKGTTQVVLAVVVVSLAMALIQVFRLHRQDNLAAKKELLDQMELAKKDTKEQWEKSQKVIMDNTSAMNLMATSNGQLKEAIYHLSQVIESKLHKD